MWDISLLHRIHRMKTISERRKQNTGYHIRARRTCREAVVGFWEAKVNVTTMHSRSFNQHCKSFERDKVMHDKPKLTILRFNILVGHKCTWNQSNFTNRPAVSSVRTREDSDKRSLWNMKLAADNWELINHRMKPKIDDGRNFLRLWCEDNIARYVELLYLKRYSAYTASHLRHECRIMGAEFGMQDSHWKHIHLPSVSLTFLIRYYDSQIEASRKIDIGRR